MKRIKSFYRGFRDNTKHFFVSHYRVSILLVIFSISTLFLFGHIAKLTFIFAIPIYPLVLTLIRLVYYKIGYSTVIRDFLYVRLKKRLSGDELEEKYQEICIHRASNYFVAYCTLFFLQFVILLTFLAIGFIVNVVFR